VRFFSPLIPHRSCLAATAATAAIAVALSGCGSAPRQQQDTRVERPPAPPSAAKAPVVRAPAQPSSPATPTLRTPRGGGYYLDDGPGDSPPPDLDSIAEPVPQLEPLYRATMRPYVVLGQTFTPMTELQPYKVQGVASWYGRRYHGKRTSNGEIYDMYGISAAHPTLPIPSYARVTHLASGRSIVVRVNDRGPFLDGRLIDLSYTAAHRLGVLGGGSAMVEVETIIPDGTAPAQTYAGAPRLRPPAAAATRSAAAPATPYGGQSDPILAIAAAARDPDGPPAAGEAVLATPAVATSATLARAAVAESGAIFLQLGAFGSRENAESFLERARVQLERLSERLQMRTRDGLFRVHAGPYANANEAKQAAERIATALGTRPVVSR
jgi:rare lipoprotein A